MSETEVKGCGIMKGDMSKGLLVNILKSSMGSFDAGANFSSKYDSVILVPSPDFPNIPEIFDVTPDCPAVAMVKRKLFSNKEPYLTAYPVVNGVIDTERSSGGCYISTCDGRFPADYPVPLHDRKEF